MAGSRLTSDKVRHISGLVSEYISKQCKHYKTRAVPLSARQRAPLTRFFSAEVLDRSRVLVLRGERVPNPEFYPELRSLGFESLPDQSTMAAITFCDVVVSHEPFSNGLLFHELVHVEQYRQLGVPRFSELYVRGFLNGGCYEEIPLEVNAYTLEDHFRRDQLRGFSVEQEVAKWALEGRL
jgi:hypothetical protein